LNFTLLAVSVLSASIRTFWRYRRNRKLDLDDAFLLFAVLCQTGESVLGLWLRELVYFEMYLILQMIPFDGSAFDKITSYYHLYNAASCLTWACIFSVKFSFMFFFQKLLRRVRHMVILWWVAMVVLIISAGIAIPFSFFICSDFSPDAYRMLLSPQILSVETNSFLGVCPSDIILFREKVYLMVTCALDILTDVLLISIPITLLWNVNITFKRKVALGGFLCLSCFMIVIACVRVGLCMLPSGIVDSVWLSVWQGTESTTAILMVSLTAFRGLFGQDSSKNSSRKKWTIKTWGFSRHDREVTRHAGLSRVDIPKPTMTGMNTLIRWSGRDEVKMAFVEESTEMEKFGMPPAPPRKMHNLQAMGPGRESQLSKDGVYIKVYPESFV
jgi:hypothetical protein